MTARKAKATPRKRFSFRVAFGEIQSAFHEIVGRTIRYEGLLETIAKATEYHTDYVAKIHERLDALFRSNATVEKTAQRIEGVIGEQSTRISRWMEIHLQSQDDGEALRERIEQLQSQCDEERQRARRVAMRNVELHAKHEALQAAVGRFVLKEREREHDAQICVDYEMVMRDLTTLRNFIGTIDITKTRESAIPAIEAYERSYAYLKKVNEGADPMFAEVGKSKPPLHLGPAIKLLRNLIGVMANERETPWQPAPHIEALHGMVEYFESFPNLR